MDFNISPKMSDYTEIINIYTHIDYGFNNLLLPQETIMTDYTEVIKPDTGCGNIKELLTSGITIPQTNSVGINISELLPQGTIIPQTNSVGINISEIVIRKKGDCIDCCDFGDCIDCIDRIDCINKSPDCVVFGSNETDTGKPPEGTLCMFCKNKPAIHSVKKMKSSVGQYAGWHYCAECKTRY